ncbi:Hpt domain-containing protein [Bdellovibrio sp. HCB2-146]|uniref:Hpt domain-containing protein n=1 Tax=Bdellovibrio sp. HCB2-146 TaxID=3394362 RepID=UPI0039BC4CCF
MELQQDLERVANYLKTSSDFDIGAFNQLTEDAGALVALRVLARFCLSAEDSLKAIETAIEEDHSENAWKACHKLTGSCELIGLKAFGQRSRKLSSDIRAMPELHLHGDELNKYIREGRHLIEKIETNFPRLKSYL